MYDQASYSTETPVSNPQIIAGGTYTTRKVTIEEGEVRDAGTVIGALLAAAAATVTVGTPVSGSGGTVGNGAITAVSSDAGAAPGTWQVEMTGTGATAAFKVIKPDGTLATPPTGAVGTPYNGTAGLNFSIADGANDWTAGDVIPIEVEYDPADLTYKMSLAAATDGSQDPVYVLAQDVDATDGDTEALAYETGQVVGSALTLGTGHTIASIREVLRDKGLIIDD